VKGHWFQLTANIGRMRRSNFQTRRLSAAASMVYVSPSTWMSMDCFASEEDVLTGLAVSIWESLSSVAMAGVRFLAVISRRVVVSVGVLKQASLCDYVTRGGGGVAGSR
jgi:hypothetical protein